MYTYNAVLVCVGYYFFVLISCLYCTVVIKNVQCCIVFYIRKKSGKLVIQELRKLEGTGQNLKDIIWKRSSLSASSPIAKSLSSL